MKRIPSQLPTLIGILGHPLTHSLSPLMHNAAFRAMGLDWRYIPIDLANAEVGSGMELIRSGGLEGANVTVPYKEAVIPHLDDVEKHARILGSVNTIFRKGARLAGASTDGEGFLRSLGKWRKKLRGSKGILVGAGGSAKAVAEALASSGCREILIVNRTPGRAKSLARALRTRYRALTAEVVSHREAQGTFRDRDWVIQTTSVGLRAGDGSPFSLAKAPRSILAVDLIYHRETEFLREARRRGMPRLGGIGMLLHQGALSFECWTGRKAPLIVMQKVLLDRLASK